MPSDGRPRRLRIGPLEATWDHGALRWISVDGTEVLRGILLTARDANWLSITPRISQLQLVTRPDRFSISFQARFVGRRLDVECKVAYSGDHTGRIDVSFAGWARIDSVVQRLGLIVLHPASLAGQPIETIRDVVRARETFPALVTARRFASDVDGMRWPASDDLEASLAFRRDRWETEDQRAWTDASFKSYSPPLSRRHPMTLPTGAVAETGVRLEVARKDGLTVGSLPRQARRMSRHTERVLIGGDSRGPVPAIGLAWPGPIVAGDIERVRALRPAHLRVIADTQDIDWREGLRAAGRDAVAIGTSLQLELVGFDDEAARAALQVALADVPAPITDALVFGTATDDGLVTTAGSNVSALRDRLCAHAPGLTVGGGSRAGYAELAGGAVPMASLGTVAFTISPQIHATDAATIIENLGTLPVLVESAAALTSGRQLDVLGSFRPRLDAYETPPGRGLSSARFDDRLGEGLGVAWLVGTLSGLLTGTVRRITVLEASGRAGVLTSRSLGEVFGAVSSIEGGEVLGVQATPGVSALAIQSGALHVIVANLRDRSTTIDMELPVGWRPRDDRSPLPLGRFEHRIFVADPR
jgi:D-apionolactonase